MQEHDQPQKPPLTPLQSHRFDYHKDVCTRCGKTREAIEDGHLLCVASTT